MTIAVDMGRKATKTNKNKIDCSACLKINFLTVKPVLSGHSKQRPKIGFQDRLSLNEGQK